MKLRKCAAQGDAPRPIKRLLCLMISTAALICMPGCASGASDYDRHNLSRVWVPQKDDLVYFDATITSTYPRESAAAEAARLSWIDEWLKIRKLCAQGYDLLEKRDIRRDEDNPYLHDLRYVLRCR